MAVQLELIKGSVQVLTKHQVQREGRHHLQVVLCFVPEDDCYVCWLYNLQSKGHGNGDYYHPSEYRDEQQTYERALAAFYRRVCREEGIDAQV